MAHNCPVCYCRCHCGGDIDDIVFNDTKYECHCTCCESASDIDDYEDDYEDEVFTCYVCGIKHRPGDCIVQGTDE